MKKLITCSIVLAILIPLSGFTQPSNYVKLGLNYSSFRTEDGKSEPGLTLGLGKDFYPIQSSNAFWGVELDYVRKKVTLENKTWPTGIDLFDSNVVVGDIRVDITYLEGNVGLGYGVQLKEDAIFAQIRTGFLVSFLLKNHTDGEIKDIIYLEPEERGKFEFDYRRRLDKGPSSSIGIQFDTRIIIKPVALILSYTWPLTRTEGFTVLTIHDKLDSLQITLAYAF